MEQRLMHICSFCKKWSDMSTFVDDRYYCSHCNMDYSIYQLLNLDSTLEGNISKKTIENTEGENMKKAAARFSDGTISRKTAKTEEKNMKTILVRFKNGDRIYTYNTNENLAIGDTINVDYLSADCKVVDVINDSLFVYVDKMSGELKEKRTNVNDIFIKNLSTERIETTVRHFMKENKK